MRELQLWDSGETMSGAFGDIEALAGDVPVSRLPSPAGARMRGARGGRDGNAAGGRLESYHKLQDEQAHQARQMDQRAQIDEKRRWKAATKALRKRVEEKDGR